MNQYKTDESFFGDGIFAWQFETAEQKKAWDERVFNKEKYWGGFPEDAGDKSAPLPDWAVGPFTKYADNPIFAPDASSWDCGRFGGGVHNGSILQKDGLFYYIYRGEFPAERVVFTEPTGRVWEFDYKCDIGVAVSRDGIHFERVGEPIFRHGENEKYSFEDVCCVTHDGTYYLFCNRWSWDDPKNPKIGGVYLATSTDLEHWTEHGLVFPEAERIHRNACVLQNERNEAVRVNGKFIMYMNNRLIAESEDMIHWTSRDTRGYWPGGEGCFALHRDGQIVLFTGGHHTGHFYAIGEVLFSPDAPDVPVDFLRAPVLYCETKYPYEDGYSATEKGRPVSNWRDTIFFTGMTQVGDELYIYYGGSEYYTCLCKVKLKK